MGACRYARLGRDCWLMMPRKRLSSAGTSRESGRRMRTKFPCFFFPFFRGFGAGNRVLCLWILANMGGRLCVLSSRAGCAPSMDQLRLFCPKANSGLKPSLNLPAKARFSALLSGSSPSMRVWSFSS